MTRIREDAELTQLRRKDLAILNQKIHEHRQENPSMIRATALQRLADYKEMTAILAEKIQSWPAGTTEHVILQKQIDKLASAIARERAVLRPRQGETTPEMIERARNYPIESLLPGRSMQKCLWHDEKNPSMSVSKKHNRARCFSQCNRSWDTIDIYQKLHGCSFHEAVRALQ